MMDEQGSFDRDWQSVTSETSSISDILAGKATETVVVNASASVGKSRPAGEQKKLPSSLTVKRASEVDDWDQFIADLAFLIRTRAEIDRHRHYRVTTF